MNDAHERLTDEQIEEVCRAMQVKGAGITHIIPPIEAIHDDQWCLEAATAITQLRADLAAAKYARDDWKRIAEEFDTYHCCPECGSQNVEQTYPAGSGDFGAFKCHDCDHQGEIGEDFPSGTALRSHMKKLESDLATANEKLRVAEEGLKEIEADPTDYRVGSDENMERVRETARDALSRIGSAETNRLRENAEGGGE